MVLQSVTGLKNQQIRQNDGMKTLADIVDPSGFLGPWRTELVYSGLKVSATSDTSVPQVMAGNMFELNLPNAGVKTTVGKIPGVGTMIKKGAGDLAITDAGSHATTLRLAGSGTLSLGRDKSNDDHPVAGAWLHLDASQTNTMTFVAGADGKTYVSRWNDCDGANAYAEQALAIARSRASSSSARRARSRSAAPNPSAANILWSRRRRSRGLRTSRTGRSSTLRGAATRCRSRLSTTRSISSSTASA